MSSASDLMPPNRGFCAVGLVQPKTSANVGAVLRASFCFGAKFVVVSGHRYKSAATDTPKFSLHNPMFHADDVMSMCPHDCEPVAVDLVPDAVPLHGFQHAPRSYYIFGPEDGTLGKDITRRCSRTIVIPSHMCLNLAAAVNVVLYDRIAKQLTRRMENVAA